MSGSAPACGCGEHGSQAEHEADSAGDEPASRDAETLNGRVIQSAVMRALFRADATRRRFLAAVGSSGCARGDLERGCRFGALEAMAQDKGSLAREEGPQDRLHPDHLRDAAHHGRIRSASTASRA